MFITKLLFILSIFALSACNLTLKNEINITKPNAFTGSYTSTNDGKIYKVLIAKTKPFSNSPIFMIFGFYKDNEVEFMSKFNLIIKSGIQGKNNICPIMQDNFCAKKTSLNTTCIQKNMLLSLNIYLDSPGKDGLFMSIQGSNGNLFGDKYDYIKGNFLVPKKEYFVKNIKLNDSGELESITFKETGFIQAFTSETLVFKKNSANSKEFTNKIYAYNKVKNALQSFTENNLIKFFNSCNFVQ